MTTENIFANPDTFRAKLSELQAVDSEPTPEPVAPESKPEDVIKAEELSPSSHEPESPEPEQVSEEEESEESEPAESAKAPEKSHFIPKSRLKEETDKRKASEEQLRTEREERIRLETQLQMINQMQEQAKQAAPQPQPAPQPNLDPLDPEAHEYTQRQIQELKQQLQNVAQETAEKTKQLQYMNLVTAQEQAFEREHPDFKDAMEHVKNVELSIAKTLIADARTAESYVANKLKGALEMSITTGKNAAETIYNMAKTYGYSAKAKPSQGASSEKNGADLNAINRNMERSVNTAGIGNSANMNNAIPKDITAALNKTGNLTSGVNPDMFHKILSKMK